MRKKVKWRLRKAAGQAKTEGFAYPLKRHVALYYKRGSQLVVSFDNMKSRDALGQVYPWAYTFVEGLGHSHLGIIMQRRCDWFRQPDLEAYFDGLRKDGFFDQFEKVIFYGASMGGYGALSYSSAVPGSDVVVFSPQTSLDRKVVPFETRYRDGFRRGRWKQTRYCDAVDGVKAARRVTVFADPFHTLDAAHAKRLQGDNVVWAKCPSSGHNPARLMKFMGCLQEAVTKAFDGRLSEVEFRQIWRAHRDTQALARVILRQGMRAGHLDLVLRTMEQLEKSQPDWNFRQIESEVFALWLKKNEDYSRRVQKLLSA